MKRQIIVAFVLVIALIAHIGHADACTDTEIQAGICFQPEPEVLVYNALQLYTWYNFGISVVEETTTCQTLLVGDGRLAICTTSYNYFDLFVGPNMVSQVQCLYDNRTGDIINCYTSFY